MTDDEYAPHTQRFSNCWYEDEGSTATCVFELNLAPGETARVPEETAVELQVLPNAPQGWRVNANYWVTGFSGSLTNPPEGELGDGPELRLEKVPDAFEGGDEGFANVLFDVGANPADLAAVGTEIAGEPDDVVTMEVGVENHGPADIAPVLPGFGSDTAEQANVMVTMPDGVTVVEVLDPAPEELAPVSSCAPIVDGEPDFANERRNEPGATSYLCRVIERALAPGETWLFRFRVEITGSEDATGQVEVSGISHDSDPANDTAEVTLTIGSGGTGGGLPVTGASTGLLAGVGALAIAVGLGLYLLARRRRIVVRA